MRLLAVYILLSVALLFAQPGYSVVGAWAILLSGAAGSLSLVVDSLPRFYSSDLDGVTHFNSEAALVCGVAFVIWVAGAVLTYWCGKSQKRAIPCVVLVFLWIVGSFYNVLCFAIRSV
jgi:hypothetical protein